MNERDSGNNFWLFLELLARRRTFIIGFVTLAVVVAAVTSMVLPKWYRASSLLLPPKDLSLPSPGPGALADVVSVTRGLNLPVMVTASDVYARMLKSRTIAGAVIDRFDLVERYQQSSYVETYDVLMDRADFRVTEEGLLEVSVEDKDPVIAAAVTNAFVEVLDSVNREIVTERVRQNREFVDERLVQAKAELDSSRARFQEFQVTNRTIDFGEQTRLAIDQAVRLKVDLAQLDIDIAMREPSLGEGNAELVELRREREMTQDQLDRLEKSNPDSSFFSLPVSEIPNLRGRYEVLYSRVKVAEQIYRILLEQVEQVKYQELEKTPTISVLDRATPPEIKSRPKRRLIVVMTFVLALLLAVLVASLMEYVNRLQTTSPENHRRAMLFVNAWLGWLPGVKKRK